MGTTATTPTARKAPAKTAAKKATAKKSTAAKKVAAKKTAAPATKAPAKTAAPKTATRRTAPSVQAPDAVGFAGPAGDAVSGLFAGAVENTLAINPLVGIEGSDVADAAKALLKVVAVNPGKATSHYGRYLRELGKVVTGESELAPQPKDRRFTDTAWQSNAMYKRLMQGYLATQKELNEYIDESSLETRDKGKAHFFASLITDALAPSNWVLGNPTAVRKIIDTGGVNLVKGLQNLVNDVRHNNMMPSSVDSTPFKVGENIAASPGQVVLRHEMFELLQYTPTTAQVHSRPLVMSPPQVNKYYAVDLTPEKSLVKWAMDSGVQLFMVSWRNPTVEQRHWSLTHYVKALDAAVDTAREITGSPDANMWGSCSGGMTLAAYLGWLAARGEQGKVVNTTWAVCVLDTGAALGDSTLGLFNTPATLRAAKARSRRRGIVTGEELARMFAWLRPNDLIWNYWVNNYLLGNKPPAYDILAWNADTTRLPGQFHCDLLDLFEHNPYLTPNALEIDGVPIDFSKVQVGAYVVGGITDHITPWRACYGTARLLGPQTTFVLANAGHLQSLVNPPGSPKSFFSAAPATVEGPDDWAKDQESARQDGSWWPHWRAWIQARSGKLVDAPAQAGSRKHEPLGPAPGTYVFER